VYSEAVALVEEYQQALSVASMGGVRDLMSVFAQLDLRSSPQVPLSNSFIFLITKMMGSFFDTHAWKGWKFVKGIIHAAMLVFNNC
jgi:hypothetical protein